MCVQWLQQQQQMQGNLLDTRRPMKVQNLAAKYLSEHPSHYSVVL
jgi:hypothetical protein